ncbi:tripartite tricarboxylate transporter substrate binding protein [Aliigemmobacter aestuarii]|uniref:Tripartite tricarboxylate transporter substrate binding protein n=1 Tax=Aliigemmobacter aestuarii TaxID=1445661 RepID=A0A4V3V0F3_9RHOB|nr:tripartite tricarboxylate transporter substrate binding protein [Gemmobacter aestuarii]THD83742.1 tripartite tricarboxylate transporter substrate binding protein [Gemmobacter aestuarii]
MKKMHLLGAAAGLALAAMTGTAMAEYPEKPVTFIVPWPPGDLEDVLTRMIAEEMQNQTGVPAAVVNKPGGGGVVGGVEVATAAPDGYTVGSFVVGIPTIKTMGADAQIAPDALEPVGIFLTYPFLIATKADAPYSTMQELAEHSKANDVRLGHFGYGLEPTLLTFKAMADLGGKFSAEAAFDAVDCSTLSNGDADVINTTAQLVLSCLGDLKVLATITNERTAITPDVPTLGEVVPGLDVTLWNGLFVPKGTPQEVKDKIAAVAQTVIASDAAQEIASTTGALVYWKGAEDSAAQIASDMQMLMGVREALGVTE